MYLSTNNILENNLLKTHEKGESFRNCVALKLWLRLKIMVGHSFERFFLISCLKSRKFLFYHRIFMVLKNKIKFKPSSKSQDLKFKTISKINFQKFHKKNQNRTNFLIKFWNWKSPKRFVHFPKFPFRLAGLPKQ